MKQVNKNITEYMCETCGYEFEYKTDAEDCEERHICRHEKTRIRVRLNAGTIQEECCLCHKDMDERIKIHDLSQECLRNIYSIAREDKKEVLVK